ncbi:MAG TPA: NimC/NimA family protein, partial [Ruminococcaceae bacterium]|nr:NimC/NimA family protein [Oscillospiraceae bacterium]HBQ46219.1 NimC/NimA family protein [Oscillospiraceae bacterium]HBT91724.1 NimC/NimA family protein [Oscillospiraceae bacterium]
NKAVQFLKDCGTFYLATDDGGQPRVRPFGAVMEYGGRAYICTSNTKACFRQMKKNPRVQIAAAKGNDWIRITAQAIPDPSGEAKRKMLEDSPFLQKLYRADDGTFEVLYLKDATATLYPAAGEPETFPL